MEPEDIKETELFYKNLYNRIEHLKLKKDKDILNVDKKINELSKLKENFQKYDFTLFKHKHIIDNHNKIFILYYDDTKNIKETILSINSFANNLLFNYSLENFEIFLDLYKDNFQYLDSLYLEKLIGIRILDSEDYVDYEQLLYFLYLLPCIKSDNYIFYIQKLLTKIFKRIRYIDDIDIILNCIFFIFLGIQKYYTKDNIYNPNIEELENFFEWLNVDIVNSFNKSNINEENIILLIKSLYINIFNLSNDIPYLKFSNKNIELIIIEPYKYNKEFYLLLKNTIKKDFENDKKEYINEDILIWLEENL